MRDAAWYSDLLKKIDEATAIAREAQAAGDTVTSLAAAIYAAQLLQIYKQFEEIDRLHESGRKPRDAEQERQRGAAFGYVPRTLASPLPPGGPVEPARRKPQESHGDA